MILVYAVCTQYNLLLLFASWKQVGTTYASRQRRDEIALNILCDETVSAV